MKNPPQLSPEFVDRSLSNNADWDFSNDALYKLCAENPDHRRPDVIMAKVMLIGRAYAAAIERRPKPQAHAGDGDDFYRDAVRQIRDSDIDIWFRTLRESPDQDVPDRENIALNLKVHANLMGLFRDISGINKPSLTSKYLHFHFRRRFYIFDSRAREAISKLTGPVPKDHVLLGHLDDDYSRFYLRCEDLNSKLNGRLCPRDLDKVLLEYGKNLPAWSDPRGSLSCTQRSRSKQIVPSTRTQSSFLESTHGRPAEKPQLFSRGRV